MNFEDINFEELDEKFRIREESDSYLFKAYDEPIKSKSIKLAKKALEINSKNIDAENHITSFERDPIKRLEKYRKTMEKGKEILEQDDIFNKDNIGIFWGIVETRPYMRTKHAYLMTLMEVSQYTKAIEQCEEMLLLCNGDNMGIRYILVGLYAMLERFEQCEKLYKLFPEYSIQMWFPKAIIEYKKGNYKECKEILKEIAEENIYILDYLVGNKSFSYKKIQEFERSRSYSLGSESEAYFVLKDLKYLLDTVPMFIQFVEKSI